MRSLLFVPGDSVWVGRIKATFGNRPDLGVVEIDGRMIDKPHLRAAELIRASVAPG